MRTRTAPIPAGRADPTRARLMAFGVTFAAAGAFIFGMSANIHSEDAALMSATTVLRTAAMIGGGYLLTMIALGAIVRMLHAPAWMRRPVDRLTPLLIRRVLDVSMATGIVLSATMVGVSATPAHLTESVVPTATATATPIPTSTPSAVRGAPRPTLAGRPVAAGDPSSGQRWPNLPDPPASSTEPTSTPVSNHSSGAPVRPAPAARRRSTPVAVASTPPTEFPATAAPPAIANVAPIQTLAVAGPVVSGPPVPPRGMARDVVHIVRRGESFWSIAEDHVLADDPAAGEADIAKYWRQLIRSNASRLPVKGQPDVLFVGIDLHLPQVRSAV